MKVYETNELQKAREIPVFAKIQFLDVYGGVL